MTYRRELIRSTCWAVALSFAMALPATNSQAQPMGPSLSQLQLQTQAPVYEKAQARRGPPRDRRWRGGRRWGGGPRFGVHFGFGPRRHCWWGPHGRRCRWW
jgi:hypothetical protein